MNVGYEEFGENTYPVWGQKPLFLAVYYDAVDNDKPTYCWLTNAVYLPIS